LRAAAYIRVSSKSQTLDMQKVAIERAARARRDTITEWYSDKLSGRTLSRPGLEQLRLAARAGRVGRLYVYRLDLARSGIRDTFEVIEEILSPLERAQIQKLRRAGKTIREIAVAVHAPRATVARALSQNPPPPARSGRPARKRAAVARPK
jgi:DNA invertase Pin-like site-specific DNA recombinase